MEKLVDPSVKVSPDEHSTPNIAQISPGPIDSTSCSGYISLFLAILVMKTDLHLVTVHAHQTGNLDLLSRARVENLHGLLESTLIHAHISQLSKAALFELERQSNERGVSCGCQGDLRGTGLVHIVCKNLSFGGVGQIIADTIEQGLNAGILDRGAHEDGGELEGDSRAPDSIRNFEVGRLLVHQDGFANLLVDLRELLDELGPFSLRQLKERFRDFVRYHDVNAI